MAAVDVVASLAEKAKGSQPPVQWIWAVLLFLAAFITGYFVSKDLEKAALEQAELEAARKRVEDMKLILKLNADVAQAKQIREVVARYEAELQVRETLWAKRKAELDAQRKVIENAKTWKDLENA